MSIDFSVKVTEYSLYDSLDADVAHNDRTHRVILRLKTYMPVFSVERLYRRLALKSIDHGDHNIPVLRSVR